MKSTALKNTSLVAALLTAGAIGGAGVGAFNALHTPSVAAPAAIVTSTPGITSTSALPDFPQITERYGPAVVNISVTGTSKVSDDDALAQGEDGAGVDPSRAVALGDLREVGEGAAAGDAGRASNDGGRRGDGRRVQGVERTHASAANGASRQKGGNQRGIFQGYRFHGIHPSVGGTHRCRSLNYEVAVLRGA